MKKYWLTWATKQILHFRPQRESTLRRISVGFSWRYGRQSSKVSVIKSESPKATGKTWYPCTIVRQTDMTSINVLKTKWRQQDRALIKLKLTQIHPKMQLPWEVEHLVHKHFFKVKRWSGIEPNSTYYAGALVVAEFSFFCICTAASFSLLYLNGIASLLHLASCKLAVYGFE